MKRESKVRCCPENLVRPHSPKLKVLDCTIRDGGLCNNWQFSHAFVNEVFEALCTANIDYMEIGYRRSPSDDPSVGPWRFCREEDLRDVTSDRNIKLSTMVDIGRVRKQDIPKASTSVIDMVRIATYAHQLSDAQRILDHCLENGYETFVNVMAISTLSENEVDKFLRTLSRSGTHNVAIVDSFGVLFPVHIRYLVQKYRDILGPDIKLGVHCHNNQQQALLNSIAAIEEGIDFVDATIHGMGRGAGNCPLELLLLYLDDTKYDLDPILGVIDHFAVLKEELQWGCQLPYAITGHHNLHPRIGIDKMKRQDKYRVRQMHEQLSNRFYKRNTG